MSARELSIGDTFKIEGYRLWLKVVEKHEDGSLFAVSYRTPGPGTQFTIPADQKVMLGSPR